MLPNAGNAPATFSVGTPTNPAFALTANAGGITLKPGDTWSPTGTFTPVGNSTATAVAPITATGVICGSSTQSLLFNGTGGTGSLSRWQSTIDLGHAPCGGAAPAPQKMTLANSSTTTDATITGIDTSSANGFTVDVTVGARVLAGGTLPFTFTAPSVPQQSSLNPQTGTIVFQTDADAAPHAITFTEEPQGAVLAFDTRATPNFGSFGTEILLQSASQSFNVVNSGNAPANITLTAAEHGVAGSGPSGDAGADATVAGAAPAPFSVSVPTFTIPAPMGGATAASTQESLKFEPVHANGTTGSVAIAVDATTTLCTVRCRSRCPCRATPSAADRWSRPPR